MINVEDLNVVAKQLLQLIDDECSASDDWITVQEATALLGVSSARVKKMAADGVLKSVSGTRRLYIYKDAVTQRILYIEQFGLPTRGRGVAKG